MFAFSLSDISFLQVVHGSQTHSKKSHKTTNKFGPTDIHLFVLYCLLLNARCDDVPNGTTSNSKDFNWKGKKYHIVVLRGILFEEKLFEDEDDIRKECMLFIENESTSF